MPNPILESDTLFFWMRSTASYSLPGAYINPHPYSCILEQELAETTDGGLTFDYTRAAVLGISLDKSGAVPVIRLVSTQNIVLATNKAIMMFEARL